MSKKNSILMIVESPAKARTIGKILGSDTRVLASMGHVRDLPSRELGVDIANGFAPHYELTPNGKKVMKSLKEAAKDATEIYLATDPDREGEAISWHLQRLLEKSTKGNFHRISYHEITRSAIQNAFDNPSEVSLPLVDAQQARRVLDRLVGYQVSPLLWQNVEKDTSAGRVQSVALRLIVEREREIQAFQPVEYWTFEAIFSPRECPEVRLKTKLTRINGKKANVTNADDANALAAALADAGVNHAVSSVTSTKRNQHAAPPFITSTLQQAAGSALRFGTTQTMKLAQELYEGVELENGNVAGLITYMRTDSVNVAAEAQNAARDFIARTYGKEYVPPQPNRYRSGKSAQEAHEAIRPTNVERTPEAMAPFLSSQQLKLYRLIWNRFVASQMTSAKQVDHAIEITSKGGMLDECAFKDAAENPRTCTFRAAARETVFPGYLVVYSMKDLGQEDEMDNFTGVLPELRVDMVCDIQKPLIPPQQCFTQPPGRYSEAMLVKALEGNGVGRPSTFASIVKTILDRTYVEKEKSALVPTALGFRVNDYLVGSFPTLFDIGFTAQMEGQLDAIEGGEVNWVDMLQDFYGKFSRWLAAGGGSAVGALGEEQCRKILEFFPANYQFDPPIQGVKKVYDDEKFITSLRKKLDEEPNKILSNRQGEALLALFARYAAKDPAMMAKAQAIGMGEMVQNQIDANEARDNQRRNAPENPSVTPEMVALLEAMKEFTWAKPVKRGRKTYDDGKFYRSIAKQVNVSNRLSEAQQAAVVKLAAKYAAAYPGVQALIDAATNSVNNTAALEVDLFDDEATPTTPATHAVVIALPPAEPPVDDQKCQALLNMVEEIKEWREPTKRGKRVYNDQEFAMSLKEQYQLRRVLTPRQLEALVKMLGKYSEQLTDNAREALNQYAAEGNGERKAAVEIGEKCPQCGAELLRRFAKGSSFIGCSAYPKCRYSRKG